MPPRAAPPAWDMGFRDPVRSGATRMNGEAVSYVTRHAAPSLRSRSGPHPGPTPMTVNERWPPARLRLCPATHPRTNGTAPSRPLSTLSSRSTSRGFSNALMPKESHFPTSSEKSSRRTSNAGASNTDSCASSAMPAGMRSWWRSVASAGGSARAVGRDAWPIPPPISSNMCCPSNPSVSGCCRSPTRYGSCSRHAPRCSPESWASSTGRSPPSSCAAPDCARAPARAPAPSPSSSASDRR